jgi:hypothetical protein
VLVERKLSQRLHEPQESPDFSHGEYIKFTHSFSKALLSILKVQRDNLLTFDMEKRNKDCSEITNKYTPQELFERSIAVTRTGQKDAQ